MIPGGGNWVPSVMYGWRWRPADRLLTQISTAGARARARVLAEHLLGTANVLPGGLWTGLDDDVDLLRELDKLVLCCDTCGWWVEVDEAEDGNCRQCVLENED